jgi:hypothetical protein
MRITWPRNYLANPMAASIVVMKDLTLMLFDAAQLKKGRGRLLVAVSPAGGPAILNETSYIEIYVFIRQKTNTELKM